VKSELSLPEPELSPNALTVLESRYLSKDESGGIIETPKEMLWRVAKNIALMDVLYEPYHEEESSIQGVSFAFEDEASLPVPELSPWDWAALEHRVLRSSIQRPHRRDMGRHRGKGT